MSLIKTTTKYQCDGCGCTAEAPTSWSAIQPISQYGLVFNLNTGDKGEHYCSECIKIMRELIRKANDFKIKA